MSRGAHSCGVEASPSACRHHSNTLDDEAHQLTALAKICFAPQAPRVGMQDDPRPPAATAGPPRAEDRWCRVARRDLVDDLVDLRRLAADQALEDHPDQPEEEAVLRSLAERVAGLGELSRLLNEIESEPALRLDAVAVATRAVRRAIAPDESRRV
jgi:Glutamate dehydrogenase, C-terminal